MKTLFMAMLLVFALQITNAQNFYRQYGTQKVQQRLLQENSTMAADQAAIERYISDFTRTGNFEYYTIPIVFHVLYSNLEEFLAMEQIASQIVALNRDFNPANYQIQHPADTLENFFKLVPDSIGISFCIATQLEANGINFVPTTVEEWGEDDAIKSSVTGGADPWDTEQYLNIWIGNLADSVSGYAQMPGGPLTTDGIVIDYELLGTLGTVLSPYNEGKTLTHLVGNYLGLYDLWNETRPCGDDYVKDTPIHNAPNTGERTTYRHVSTCQGLPVEQTMNFMDNTNDVFLYMFTKGQTKRMQAVLSENGPRNTLGTDIGGCLPLDDLQTVEDREESDNMEASPQISVFPNPAKKVLYLNLEQLAYNASVQVSVTDITGKIIQEDQYSLTDSFTQAYDCSTWKSGTYFLNVFSDNGFNQTLRVVIIAE